MSESKTNKDQPALIAEFDLQNISEKHTFKNVNLPGLSGFRQQLTLHVSTNDDPASDKPEGDPGKYKVIFILNRPGFSLLPYNHVSDANSMEGDSYIAIAKPAHPHPDIPESTYVRIESEIDGQELTFTCFPNENGYLGKIELEEINAKNYSDAALKSFRGVSFVLSSLSFRYDVPLNIFQIDIIDLQTGSLRLSIVKAFQEIPYFGDPARRRDKEFTKYASYYREGLISSSVYYQFLCFYKIIEGLRERRAKLNKEAAKKGAQTQNYLTQRISDDEEEQIAWLNSIFVLPQAWDEMALSSIFPAESFGRKISDIIHKDKELHKIRLKIAHDLLLSNEPTVSIDDALDLELVYKWLPLTKCIARLMMNEEFPEKEIDLTPHPALLKLYRSRSFTSRIVDGRIEYDPAEGSLEFMRDISTEIRGGKITVPQISIDFVKEGINIDGKGAPNVIYVLMEIHNDGSEHHLNTLHFGKADKEKITCFMYKSSR